MEIKNGYPHLSLAERDRRWGAIRAKMAESDLDALLIRGHSGFWYGFMADIRYVTGVIGHSGYCVFPREGEPTVFLWFGPASEWCRTQQDWVTDIRGGAWPFGATKAADRLKEMGLGSGRIGIVGLPGEREPEGIFPHGAYLDLQKALPGATLENATGIIESLRWIKSEEEVACQERASAIGDKAIEAMARAARPGVRHTEVYGEMVRVMLAEGSEPPTMLLWEAGQDPRHAVYAPPDLPLQRGDVIVNEISPKYCGYYAHPHQPVCVGKPDEELRRMFGLALAAFENGLAALRPGLPMIEMCRALTEPIREAGYGWSRLPVHGLGLANIEAPLWTTEEFSGFPGSSEVSAGDSVIEAGMVLAVQPICTSPDGSRGIPVGDTVLVTDSGPRRLSQRKLEFIEAG
ncbi:MAG: Xaa-Pro peptidase family protein [bacterium]